MRHPAWWLLAALLAGAAWALDPPDPAAPAASSPEPSRTAEQAPAAEQADTDEAAVPEEQVDEEALPAAPRSPSTGPTPQRFDPSEKVRADFPVSFPIDI